MAVTTPKARRLGAALREARESRGVGVRELAKMLEWKDHSRLVRFESGERTPKPEDVATILAMLEVNGARRDEILELTREPDSPQWLAVSLHEQRQQLAALLQFEHTATEITEVAPLLVPGLCQTPGYTRAIMSGGGVPASDVETRIAVRLGRREVLSRDVQLAAYIGEGALRQMIGGTTVVVEQLRHLIDLSARPNIEVRILPFAASWHPALEGGYTIIQSGGDSVVHIEVRNNGLFLHEKEDVRRYQADVATLEEMAMSPEASVGLIAEVINEMETTRA